MAAGSNPAAVGLVAAVFIFGTLAAVILLTRRNAAQRLKQASTMSAWAAANAMTFAEEDPRYAQLPWETSLGSVNSKALNVMTSIREGRQVLAFEQREYVTGPRPGAAYAFHQIFGIVPRAPLPQVHVRRHGWTGLLADRIPIDGGPFDARYWVFAPDPAAARAFLTPALQQWLLTFDAPGFGTVGPYLATRVPGNLHADGIEGYFRFLANLLALAHPAY